jgi:hypothetical protein
MKRSGVKGRSEIRRMMRALPDELKDEILGTLQRGGADLLAAQRASARRKTGAMAAGLSMKLLRGSATLKVGFIGKAVNRKLFYAKIIGGGRKAQTVNVTRRKGTRPYSLRVKARAPEPVIDPPAAKAVRRRFVEQLNGTWERVLRKVASGGSGDD